MKYIRFNNEIIIIFPSVISHNDMHNLLRTIYGEGISAGFIKFNTDNSMYCCGESNSINLKSCKDDDLILGSMVRVSKIM